VAERRHAAALQGPVEGRDPGRPLIAGIVSDRGSGVDPLSLVLAYKQTLLLAALYDSGSGLVLWALDGAPKIGAGKTPMLAIASDYQESKNLDQAGNVLPNSVFRGFGLRAVTRPTVTWLLPRRARARPEGCSCSQAPRMACAR